MTVIGQPINRVDGFLKVSGAATYAYEHWEAGQPLYGFIVGATIGRGRITHVDTERAEASPGVRLVMTYRNAPKQGSWDAAVPDYWRAYPSLNRAEIEHYGEPVALVVATTYAQAQAATHLVQVFYEVGEGDFDFGALQKEAYAPKSLVFGLPTDTMVGDVEAGFAQADVKIDRVYSTSYVCSQPMEPHACLAVPRDGELILYLGTQIVDAARVSIASTLQLDPKQVRVVAPYVGGGFGSKLRVHDEAILAGLAARVLNQPVKIALTREQMFQLVGSRPASNQRVRLGAQRDGRLVALAHEISMHTHPEMEYVEPTALGTRGIYAAANRLTRHRLVPVNLPQGEDVRAPGDASGLLALESAIDELAYATGIDPVELRVRNEPGVDPERGVPFSDRRIVQCMREGARRFGWERRPSKPATLRDGQWLVGYGMAAAIRAHPQTAAKARVRLNVDGSVVVRSDMTDIGTGTYTVLTQVAAEALEVPIERVQVELGDSNYPPSFGSGGSWGAANSSVAVHRACKALSATLQASGHHIPPEGLEAEGETLPMWQDPNYGANAINTYGAHFAEVGVDVDTAEIRVRRMLGVFAVGRVLNAKTARSQLIGGMIWGLSMALHEEEMVDLRSGAFVNRDLANYLVPVHADIPELNAVVLDGFDEKANVLGVKGLGELGICGAGAAVGNAVYNATGVRVRHFPITLDKLLPYLGERQGDVT
jgi:xanthine dehydrogenase YagR molybdenum-binding subunit